MDVLPILATLRRHRITAFLLVLQIALTCAIVCNAVFLISQRIHLIDLPSGVPEHELVQIQVAPTSKAAGAASHNEEDLAALRHIPGVTQAASINQLPFGRNYSNAGISLAPDQPKSTMTVSVFSGENLIETLGAHLVAGRSLQPDDYRDWAQVTAAADHDKSKPRSAAVVITQSLADRLWPGQNALGKAVYFGGQQPVHVVGVLAELAQPRVTSDTDVNDSIVLPIRAAWGQFVIRSAPGDRDRVLKAAVEKLRQNNPHRIVQTKRTYDDLRDDYFRNDRSMTRLLVGVCVALLGVTAVGIVGLGSFWVAQRRRMIGVRRALGATRGDILRYFQTENFLLASIGIVLAFAINLYLMTKYELPRLPGMYFPIGAIALWTIGQLAVLGPAMRASMVPPVVATRSV